MRGGRAEGKRDARGVEARRARINARRAKGLNARGERWRESGNARVVKG